MNAYLATLVIDGRPDVMVVLAESETLARVIARDQIASSDVVLAITEITHVSQSEYDAERLAGLAAEECEV